MPEKKKITIKEREMKIFYPEWREDLPFPELLSYKNLVVKPEELADINKGEGTKLTTVEAGADKTSAHPQPVSWLTNAGAMAYENLVEYAKLGTTLQVGGYLKTILIDADYIQAGILTGRRIRTVTSGSNRLEILAPGYTNYITWWNAANSLQSFIVDDFSGHLLIYALTFVEIGPLVSVQGNISVTGTVDGVDISVLATNYNALVASFAAHVGNASAHHSSTSAGLTITPYRIGSIDVGYTNAYDLLPYGDVYGQIGYSNRRWDKIYCVTLTQGDSIFSNKFKITEEGKNGLAFFNQKNKKIAILDDKGNFWVKGKIRTLKD